MRFLSGLILGAGLLAAALRADEPAADPLEGVPAPLAAAIRQFGADARRWAYTQHLVVYDRRGRVEEEHTVRYDPSRHYDVQWTLLRQDGKDATERQVKKYRKDMAKRTKDRKTLGELLELKQAVLMAGPGDPAETLTYEVPLANFEGSRLPPGKFRILVRIDRATQALRTIDVKLRDSWRVAGVVKVKSAGARLLFARVLPEFGPALTEISAEGSGTVVFVPVGTRTIATRTDFKHVTPYEDRFNVKIGPLKAIDF